MGIEPTWRFSKGNSPLSAENDKLEHAYTSLMLYESVMQCRAYIDNMDDHIGFAHLQMSMAFAASNRPRLRTGDKLTKGPHCVRGTGGVLVYA